MAEYSAVILAAGCGRRMGGEVKKQYIELMGKPLIYYALFAFEKSAVDELVLVVSPGDEAYCRREIVEKYGFSKVTQIVAGGEERYHSVYAGLLVCTGEYVLIHDGVRAFVTGDIIRRAMEGAREYGACVVGMPTKDTMKLADGDGFVEATPPRERLWMIQTPQAFSYELVRGAYETMLSGDMSGVTDDAMVVEKATAHPVKLIEGSYENIKVTTAGDLEIGASILEHLVI